MARHSVFGPLSCRAPLLAAALVSLAWPGWAPAQPPTAEAAEYRIAPEDLLEVSVWREPDLKRDVLVRPDGGASFPLAGDFPVAGKSVREVQDLITTRLRQYIPEPVVTVSVNKLAGYRIYVLGKVQKPGQYTVGRYVDVMQALTLAGGLTPFADEDDIKVVRRGGTGQAVFPFAYGDAKRGRGLDRNIVLQADDVVVVP